VQESPIVGEAGPDGEWTGQAVNALGGHVHEARALPTLGSAAAGEEEGPALPAAFAPRGLAQPKRPSQLSYTAPSEDGSGQATSSSGSAGAADFSKVGRNEPCPCGSGKKFKLCHGDPRKR
jgi:preprotein translocase subunit SecA